MNGKLYMDQLARMKIPLFHLRFEICEYSSCFLYTTWVVEVGVDQTGGGGGLVDPQCIKIVCSSRLVPRVEKGQPAMY